MKAGRHIISSILLLCIFLFKGQAQGLCPTNMDFEAGAFFDWECNAGRVVVSPTGMNTINWTTTGQRLGQHEIIDRNTAGLDPYGGFPRSSPNGSRYAVRLGNDFTGAEAEGITYTYQIPDTVNNFAVLFYYAVVFEDPQHGTEQQPRFRARVFNVTDNVPMDCANFDFTASASLPGFEQSTVKAGVLYKDWTPVTLNLNGYGGKTIRLEFITSDCSLGGHFGYAYIDVNTSCSSIVAGASICPEATTVRLTAPHGFQDYTWYSDITYSSIISQTQFLDLDPIPPDGTIFPVIIVPYPGFGCRDTILTTLRRVPSPEANAGPDKIVCQNEQVMLEGEFKPTLIYSWSPPQLVADPANCNTLTVPNLTAPTDLYLEVTDIITGCKNVDVTTVSPILVDTAMIISGDTLFCETDPVNTLLQLRASAPGIRWYMNDQPISGAIANSYQPRPVKTTPYYATIQREHCVDTTRKVIIQIAPNPRVYFTTTGNVQCLNEDVRFTNTSVAQPGETYAYSWRVSDGSVDTTKDLVKVFTTEGNYSIWLRSTSSFGCIDSVSSTINVINNCNIYVPSAFTPNNDGRNDRLRPVIYGAKKLKHFSIYDRAGTRIFTTRTIGEGWDGTYKGQLLASSVFVWLLEYETSDGQNRVLKGTIALIR